MRAQSSIHDSAGVTIVSNPGIDTPLEWSIRPVLRLGDALGPPETSFFNLTPYSVAAGPEGTILVLNRGNYRVVVFSREGRVLRSFGRQGKGPGEMQNPVSIWVNAMGRIRVLDWAGGTLNYDLQGNLTTEDPGAAMWLGQRMKETSAGLVHTVNVGLRSDTLLIEQLRIATATDTAVLAEWTQTPSTMIKHPTCPLEVQYAPVFAPEMVWDANRMDVVVLADYSYRIDMVGPEGRLMRSVRRGIEPRQTTRQDALRELGPEPGMTFPATETMPGMRCKWDPESLLEERGFYPFLQALDAVALSPDGYLWARRLEPGDEPGPIDVFDPTGRYVGSLPPDTPFPNAFLDGTHYLTMETGELDVEYVSVHEIERD
ncbi:MAG: 6-bladed beta-propeller [Gemmatimonadota bacterium]